MPGLDGRRVIRYDVRGYGQSAPPTTEFSLLEDLETVLERLHEIQLPTVVMVGDKDRPILAAMAGATAARIPGCEFIWMPGVDHLPSLRAPQLVTETILRYAG